MAFRSNIRQVTRQLRKAPQRIEPAVTARLKRITETITREVLEKTPVHTGRALGNFAWSQGTARLSNMEAAGSGDPGPTGSMPLGAEPRRAANEARVWATHARLKFTRPFGRYFFTNGDPKIGELEAGLLPTPERSRAPGGMVAITVLSVRTRMGLGQL